MLCLCDLRRIASGGHSAIGRSELPLECGCESRRPKPVPRRCCEKCVPRGNCFGPRGSCYSLSTSGVAYVRPFQMVHHQAQEGRRGRQARQDLHQADPRDRHRGPHGRAATRDANPRLRLAIDKARIANMPKDNIERGIGARSRVRARPTKKSIYEGYGPGGTAIYVEALTDNKNRTVGEIRQRPHQARRQPRRERLCGVPVREEGHPRPSIAKSLDSRSP